MPSPPAVHFFPTTLGTEDSECLAAVQEICRPQWATIKSQPALGDEPTHRTLDALIGSSLKNISESLQSPINWHPQKELPGLGKHGAAFC